MSEELCVFCDKDLPVDEVGYDICDECFEAMPMDEWVTTSNNNNQLGES